MNKEFRSLNSAENMSVDLNAEFHKSVDKIRLTLLSLLGKLLKLN